MTPPSLEEFVGHLRALSGSDRAAFVAALLAARGWDADRDGRRVVATKGAQTRDVYVGSPPEGADVDAVVTVPSRLPSLLTAVPGRDESTSPREARDPGTAVIDPEALYEWLLYGIDREAARALYREHFDDAFESAGTRTDAAGPAARIALIAMVIVLTVAALFAGAPLDGAVPGDTQSGAASPDEPGETPTASSETGLPADATATAISRPDVSGDNLRDVEFLTRTHLRSVQNGPVRMSVTFRGPRFLTGFDTRRSGYDMDDEVTLQVRVDSDHRYHVVQRTNFSGVPLRSADVTVERFADGDAEYRRIERNGTERYERLALSTVRDGSTTLEAWTQILVSRYMNTTDQRVETVQRSSQTRYRVVATGHPHALNHRTRDYRAVAVVRPDGVLVSMVVTYVHPGTEALVQITLRNDLSPDPIRPPEWYDGGETDTTDRDVGRQIVN
jgi:hypothetical protein